MRMQERIAARTLVVDRDGCVLLFRGSDPARPEAGTWWLTPGGGVDDGESVEEAAHRELREETGLVVADLGPVVFRRRVQFDFEGVRYDQHESFFLARVDRFEVDKSAWTEIERRSLHEHRWWSPDDLVATAETVYPEGLADILTGLGQPDPTDGIQDGSRP